MSRAKKKPKRRRFSADGPKVMDNSGKRLTCWQVLNRAVHAAPIDDDGYHAVRRYIERLHRLAAAASQEPS